MLRTAVRDYKGSLRSLPSNPYVMEAPSGEIALATFGSMQEQGGSETRLPDPSDMNHLQYNAPLEPNSQLQAHQMAPHP